MRGNSHGGFGGRPCGKGPEGLAPRRTVDLTRTVRDQFLVEAAHSDIPTLGVLESRFVAWTERVSSIARLAAWSETSVAPKVRSPTFVVPGGDMRPAHAGLPKVGRSDLERCGTSQTGLDQQPHITPVGILTD